MAEKTKLTKKKVDKTSCIDKICPIHGYKKLKTRGRVFQGTVIKKTTNKVAIGFERMLKIPKYERYEKRRTKIHARLPICIAEEIYEGDLVEVAETRPISKMVHSVVIKKIRGNKK
jgi:small subunit ribosomal protein S17